MINTPNVSCENVKYAKRWVIKLYVNSKNMTQTFSVPNFYIKGGHMWHLEDNSRKRSSTFYELHWYACLTLRITVRFTITWQNKNILSYPCRILLLDFRYCISLIVQVAIIAASVLQTKITSSITAQLLIAQRNISCETCKT